MRLIVGLGNPGPRYAENRHNIGFMAVDLLVRRYGCGPWRARFQGQLSEGSFGGQKLLLLKPLTFMNESGRAVGEACRFYKISPAQVIVLHDEIDLRFGKVKVKQGGGAGGHNGLRSIDSHLGQDYWRVRLGVGHPGQKELVHGHVLSDFAKAEQPDLDKFLDAVAREFDLVLKQDSSAFMSRVAQHLAPPRPPKPKPAAKPAGDTEPTQDTKLGPNQDQD